MKPSSAAASTASTMLKSALRLGLSLNNSDTVFVLPLQFQLGKYPMPFIRL